jgi:phenylalanyl-tRNA synthetase beta chain
MLLSYNWLKELIPDLTRTPQEVADLLVEHSYETVVKKEFALSPLVKVVRIEKIEPHPNADRLRLATITDGQEVIRVVCGAPNIAEGQVVPFSPPGTKVLDKDGQLFELTVAKIRGIESPGMLGSKRELGLGEDHDGIYVLPPDTPLRSKLSEHIPNDTILEADITPNRAHDCLSHLGIAREIAALTGLQVKEPQGAQIPQEKMGDINIEIADPELSPRYMTIAIDGIQNGFAPLWMQARLLMLDQNPHNALVDITNYVMFEIGNPTHAFDSKKLNGKKMGVRKAKANETIKLLDESQQQLSSEMLVVTNDDEPVAIAGVKGGAASQITSETNSSLLEIANFHPFSIQKTALALNLRTEAAARFLKGIDPNLVEIAARRLIYLVGEITGGKVTGFADNYPKPLKPWSIVFHPQRASQIAGVEISVTKAKELLVGIGFNVEETDSNSWQVTPPTIRLDVTGEHDVVEEVIRLRGLANIPASKDDNETSEPLTHELFVRDVIRRELVKLGFTETYNYSFEPEKTARILDIPTENHVQLKNPVAPEQAQLRTSLLPGLLANFIKNKAEFQRKNITTERSLFEIGHVYKTGDGGRVPGVIETEHLAGISLLPIESVLEKLTQLLNISKIEVIISGALSQKVIKAAKYRSPLYAFEIDLEKLTAAVNLTPHAGANLEEILASPAPVQYEELNRYPSVYRDLSLLIDPSESIEKVKGIIERSGGELLVDTDLFDEYSPDEDSQSKRSAQKSLAFHLEYRASDRTLTDEEVNTVHQRVEEAVRKEINAEIR